VNNGLKELSINESKSLTKTEYGHETGLVSSNDARINPARASNRLINDMSDVAGGFFLSTHQYALKTLYTGV
jgi:hypothetical protein